jgi:hypothetical protein
VLQQGQIDRSGDDLQLVWRDDWTGRYPRRRVLRCLSSCFFPTRFLAHLEKPGADCIGQGHLDVVGRGLLVQPIEFIARNSLVEDCGATLVINRGVL